MAGPYPFALKRLEVFFELRAGSAGVLPGRLRQRPAKIDENVPHPANSPSAGVRLAGALNEVAAKRFCRRSIPTVQFQ